MTIVNNLVTALREHYYFFSISSLQFSSAGLALWSQLFDLVEAFLLPQGMGKIEEYNLRGSKKVKEWTVWRREGRLRERVLCVDNELAAARFTGKREANSSLLLSRLSATASIRLPHKTKARTRDEGTRQTF